MSTMATGSKSHTRIQYVLSLGLLNCMEKDCVRIAYLAFFLLPTATSHSLRSAYRRSNTRETSLIKASKQEVTALHKIALTHCSLASFVSTKDGYSHQKSYEKDDDRMGRQQRLGTGIHSLGLCWEKQAAANGERPQKHNREGAPKSHSL